MEMFNGLIMGDFDAIEVRFLDGKTEIKKKKKMLFENYCCVF